MIFFTRSGLDRKVCYYGMNETRVQEVESLFGKRMRFELDSADWQAVILAMACLAVELPRAKSTAVNGPA